MRRMIIDTDTASDDAVALVLALTDPGVRVDAITVVAGNVELDLGVQNALYTREICGSTTPVYAGAARPLMRDLRNAKEVHGEDGMGEIGLPLTGRVPDAGHGVDILIDKIMAEPGVYTVVALGPLTNIALAVSREPRIAAAVKELIIMGGTGSGPGNVTPVAEFNIWVDPEAAQIVFDAGFPLTMVGWDISWKYAVMTQEEAAELVELGPLGEFCYRIQEKLFEYCATVTHLPGCDLPDPITMAIALDPDIALRVESYRVDVETSSPLTEGQTVVDVNGVRHLPPNTRVVVEADRDAFLERLRRACSTAL